MNIHDLINADFATITSHVELGKDENGPYGVIIVGTDSPQWRAEQDRQRIGGLKLRREVKADPKLKASLDPESPDGNVEFQRRVQDNLLASVCAVTVGWYGFTGAEYSPELVRAMYAKKQGWRDAVLRALDEDARFLPQPATA